jgi:antibiotic biosynthesis monooxygenase (ABM) superfamily enzyme
VSGSDLQAVKAFFDHDFKTLVFPPSQMKSGENYFRFIETDPLTLWKHSPERKLWTNVKKIWCDFLDKESRRN